jgi:hypothetical protein
MRRVIQKDLILSRDVILINGIIFLAFLAFFAAESNRTPPHVYAGFASLMMAFLPAVLVTREDKFDAMALGCSLPVRRKTIVQARYVQSVVLAVTGLLGALVFGALAPFSRFEPGDLFSWRPFLTGVTGVGLVLSIFLPFTFRFGMKGILVFLAGMQVLGVLLFTLVQVTDSSMDRVIIGKIVSVFIWAHQALGTTGFTLVLLASLALILALSYLISVRVFQNREL